MKRIAIALTVIGVTGIFVVVVLTVIEGVKYRTREEQGLDPLQAPDWVVGMTTVALWTFGFALAGLTVLAVIALIRRYRRHPTR